MKRLILTVGMVGAVAIAALSAQARGADGLRPPRGGPMFALDANHDRVIDDAEMQASVTALKALDTNGDGAVSREELKSFGPRPGGRRGGGEAGRPMPFARVVDANHDGTLSATEIAAAPAALKTLDANHDGRLSVDEFGPRLGRGRGRGEGPKPAEGK